MTTLDEGESRREGSSHSNEGLSSSSHMRKNWRVGKNGCNDGVSVFLFSTHHIPHALKPYLSTTSVSTRLVEQCLWGYRDTIFLAREYGHKTDAERTQLRVHLLQLQREKSNGRKDTTDRSESAPFFVEGQLWDLMLREPGKHPILLSESLRYQQILQDMKHLARGLLAPIEILRHRNYWLLLQEDVKLNLSDRLLHYRVVLRRSPPVTMVTRLWCDLWALLGAAWRQRERLMGVYAEGIPPTDLNGDASQLPPFPSTPPSLRDAYCERQRGHAGRHAKNGYCSGSRVTDDRQTAFEEEGDNLAFGPLLPHRVGITTLRHYAIRVPLLSLLRSLRVWKEEVAVTASRRGPNGTGRSGALPRDGFPAAKNDSVNNDTTSIYCIEDAESLNAPFFDSTVEDLEACQVPYISPEWFVRLRSRDKDVSHEWDVAAVLHSYSDDAWNIAVLTLEFMLTGFPLAESCCGHPDCSAPPTSSCFDDVMKLLVKFHGVPLEAAQNFLYAALHELSLLLRKECELPRMASEDGKHLQPEPLPQRLAEEWYLYLCRTYGAGDGMNSSGGGCSSSSNGGNSSILREVAEGGLLWSRRERWKAFQAAHALFLSDANDNSSAAGENGAGGGGTAVLDATQRVLSSLSCPLIPLHPTLCAAATRGGVVTESLKLHMQPIMSLLKPLSPSLWDLQMQLRVWRHSVERHAMVDGGCRKDGEARRNVVFREFVHVVRRILQQQPCEPNFTGDTMEEASRTIHSRLIPSGAKTFPANGSKLSHSAAQNGLLRGLMERSALFSYCTDGFFLPEHNNPAHGIDDGQDDNDSKGDDDDNRFSPVFPFSQVFLPMEDLLALLHKDVVALNDSSPSVTVAVNALDTLVGAKLPTNLRLPLALSSAAADVGLLKSFKRVIRAVDLNVAQQLTLIAGLRPLLHVAPTPKRAMLVRRYLTDVQTVEGIPYVPVPATIRGEVWGALLQVPSEATRVAIYYALNTSSISVFDRQLSVDIPRCHQYHPLLVTAEGHERMRRVIKAWLLMNPDLTYWQGIDSVCAVLLTVSFTNEALVAAQMQKLTQHYIPHGPVESSISGAKSMEDHLHQLVMMLRYCDPRLAVHLLDEVECHPEIFAISWFLTLFAHSLPVGKVCLLWDFLFLYNEAYPHCLTALCLAVLLQQRDKLLGNDFSVCLLALSRLHGIDVHLVLRDAALILRSVPSSVALLSHYFNDWAGEVRHCGVSYVSVQTILQAFNGSLWRAAEGAAGGGWMQSGLFLVDLRTHRGADVLPQRATRVEERVVGALLFPLAALHAHEDDDDDTGATKYSQRLVTQQATELLLQLDNMAMAALPPLSKTSSSSSAAATRLKTKTLPSPLPVGEDLKDGPSTALQECAMAPHVVLFTRSMEPVETAAAESLALELVRCGTPHVSILFGGFVELKREASHLVVEFEED